ncbi:salicylic acid-binding protein 2-like [Neltuma alba]|uniref:salicylic acid-binding protein 2-like n=1 Tax=Neltuma alba TaxID=207710 RepID=UPI0010A37774|nr:salicylic acid-binding protein 2-like [Prosopis alba]
MEVAMKRKGNNSVLILPLLLLLISLPSLSSASGYYGKKKHFVLIHGAGHGGWCWYKVATLLRSKGHNVTTLDLGASGINPKQVNQIGSISDYYEPLMAFMASVPAKEKVILVAHSLGGVSTSVAMEKFPHKISVAVFASANVLSQNLSYPALLSEVNRRNMSLMDSQFFFEDGPTNRSAAILFGPKFLATHMYQLSPPQDLTLALSLVRPLRSFNDGEVVRKETAVTSSRNGRVPKIFIISKNDKVIPEDLQIWMIQRSLPFDDIKVIKDSDHMLMFSQPLKLTSHLLQIANKY